MSHDNSTIEDPNDSMGQETFSVLFDIGTSATLAVNSGLLAGSIHLVATSQPISHPIYCIIIQERIQQNSKTGLLLVVFIGQIVLHKKIFLLQASVIKC